MRSASNCLFWALAMFWRRRGRHRYLLIRRSHWGPFPHVLYAERRGDRLRVLGYVPDAPRPHLVPPPLFRGHVRWGDA